MCRRILADSSKKYLGLRRWVGFFCFSKTLFAKAKPCSRFGGVHCPLKMTSEILLFFFSENTTIPSGLGHLGLFFGKNKTVENFSFGCSPVIRPARKALAGGSWRMAGRGLRLESVRNPAVNSRLLESARNPAVNSRLESARMRINGFFRGGCYSCS